MSSAKKARSNSIIIKYTTDDIINKTTYSRIAFTRRCIESDTNCITLQLNPKHILAATHKANVQNELFNF